jgi:hypothetical protein
MRRGRRENKTASDLTVACCALRSLDVDFESVTYFQLNGLHIPALLIVEITIKTLMQPESQRIIPEARMNILEKEKKGMMRDWRGFLGLRNNKKQL